MATAAVPSPPPTSTDSKSARKKKAKAEATTANGSTLTPAVPHVPAKEDSSIDAKDTGDNSPFEHPYIRDLNKHVRNIHKKIAGLQKTEAIVAENPGASLDALVKERKINTDQKNSILKKPQLEAQLLALEEQAAQYKKLDSDYQSQMQKQKDELTAQHEKALEKVREEGKVTGVTNSAAELRKKLLIFSQFLRCAAAKRATEEETETEESRAFEGALLLVYGGDDKAVQAAMDLIEGSDESVVSIEGVPLDVKYSQIKQASITHAPFQTEEEWVDSVAEARAAGEHELPASSGSDPTIAYAGLTELDTAGAHSNGVHNVGGEDPLTAPPQIDAGNAAGNAAGDKWDPAAPGAQNERSLLAEEEYEMVPRPSDELETPALAQQGGNMSWADDHPPAYDSGAAASGNLAGESWDTKAPGDQGNDAWDGAQAAAAAGAEGSLEDPTARAIASGEDADGFHQVHGRHHRGRGRGGRGFDGEFRGRGGFRGRGDRGGFRGEGGESRGRGGRGGGFRGRGEGGEFRGRGGGRGRGGVRGAGAEGQAARTS